MNQIAVVYDKETKQLLASIEFNDVITNCNILKIPGVDVVITMNVDGLFYVKDNKWYVNDQKAFRT